MAKEHAGKVGRIGGVIAGPFGTIAYGNYADADSDGGMSFNSAGRKEGAAVGTKGLIA